MSAHVSLDLLTFSMMGNFFMVLMSSADFYQN